MVDINQMSLKHFFMIDDSRWQGFLKGYMSIEMQFGKALSKTLQRNLEKELYFPSYEIVHTYS